MSNLWITCTLKAPGNYPPGDPGPGGGGQGQGGCVGDECDPPGGCSAPLPYLYCAGDPTAPAEEACKTATFTCGGAEGIICGDDCNPTGIYADVFDFGGVNYYYRNGPSAALCEIEPACEDAPGGGEPGPDCEMIYCFVGNEPPCISEDPDVAGDDACGGTFSFSDPQKPGDAQDRYDECMALGPGGQLVGAAYDRLWKPGVSVGGSDCAQNGGLNGGPCCAPDDDSGPPFGGGDNTGPQTPGGPPPAPGPNAGCTAGCGGTSPPECFTCEGRPDCCHQVKGQNAECDYATCTWYCPPNFNTSKADCNAACFETCPECLISGPAGCTDVNMLCEDDCEWTSIEVCNEATDCKDGGPAGDDGGGSNFYYDTRPAAVENTYGYNFVDDIYERNMSNRKYPRPNAPFIAVSRGGLPASVFGTKVHSSIYAVQELNNTERMFSDLPYYDITNYNLEASLLPALRTLINQVKLATGETIKRTVLNTIRQLIVSNRLDSLDGDELMNYLRGIRDVQDNYPDTRGVTSVHTGTYAAEAKAIQMAGDKAYPLRSTGYDGLTQQRMRLWKTLAPDLNKYLPITTSNGTSHKLFYSISDTVALDGSGTFTMGPGEFQNITNSVGKTLQIPVGGDFERARILKIEDTQKIMHYLGDEYSFTLNVKTDETLRVDERYDVSAARKDYYVLTPTLSSIVDLDRTNSFISNTKTTFTYQDVNSVIDNHIKYMAWPYMVFYIDSDDPIFNYITNGGEINITSKDFTMDLFEDDEDFFKFIKRIPSTVILIPSNMEDKVVTHYPSRQVAFGERELVIKINPDPEKSDIWDFPHIKTNHSYPRPGIDTNNPDSNDIFLSFDSVGLAAVEKYSASKSELPRRKLGMGQLLSNLKNFKDNWVAPDGSMLWTQLYDTIDRGMMKSLYWECPSWAKTRTKLSLGKISTNAAVNDNYLKLKEVRSNDRKINDPNYNTYTDNFIIAKASADQVVEPGPL